MGRTILDGLHKFAWSLTDPIDVTGKVGAKLLEPHDPLERIEVQPWCQLNVRREHVEPCGPFGVPTIGKHIDAPDFVQGIVLYEWALQTTNTLASINQTYTVVVFRQPPAPSGNLLLDFDPSTGGIVQMGRGKFNSSRRYLQVTPGGTSYGFSLGKTIDLNNGAPRYVDPDGSILDPLLTIVASKVIGINEPNDAPFGPSMRYQGSFAGSGSVLVSVP